MGQVARSDRDDPTDLKGLFVRNAGGQMISLDNLVTFEEATTPSTPAWSARAASRAASSGVRRESRPHAVAVSSAVSEVSTVTAKIAGPPTADLASVAALIILDPPAA